LAVATVTSKGQVTVPKEVCDDLGIEAGTNLHFVRTSSGCVLEAADRGAARLAGMLA